MECQKVRVTLPIPVKTSSKRKTETIYLFMPDLLFPINP